MKMRYSKRLYNYSVLFFCLSLGLLTSIPVIFNSTFMELFGLSDAHSGKILLVFAAVSMIFFLLFTQRILSWVYRIYRSFGALSVASKATVSVEFLLVIPVILCLIMTIFALAEIAHAQVVFRYAAYAAMRSGIDTDHNANTNILKYEFDLPSDTKENMKLAAATALSGLYTKGIYTTPSPTLSVDKLSALYYNIGGNIGGWSYTTLPWKDEHLAGNNIKNAYKALEVSTFSAKRDSSKIILPPTISVVLEYRFPLRAGSLFWFIAPKYNNKYPYISLKRTCSADSTRPYTMLSTGQNYDLPKLDMKTARDFFSFFNSFSIVSGDSVREDIDK